MSTLKKTKGCQKIEMKLMPNESNRHVTFSKRRSGIFKKASELCTLTGAKIAIVIFSHSQKVYSFGDHDVKSIIHRYLTESAPRAAGTMQDLLSEAHRKAKVCQLNGQLNDLTNEIEFGRKHIAEMQKARKSEKWCEGPIDKMSFQQLQQLKSALENMQKFITEHKTTPTALTPIPGIGSSSSYPTKTHQMLQASQFQSHISSENDSDFDLNM